MNVKLTKKQVMNDGLPVVNVGNIGHFSLLLTSVKIGHIERNVGWACDVYKCRYGFNDVYITYGYDCCGTIKDIHGLFDKYNKFAAELVNDYSGTYEGLCVHIDKLLNDYLIELFQKNGGK